MTGNHPWPVLALLGLALVVWSPRRALTGRRVRLLAVPERTPAPRRTSPPFARSAGRHVLAGAAGLAIGLLLGGPPGVLAGLGVAVGGERLLGRWPADAGRDRRASLLRELPAACDLVGVCLSSGMPVAGALAAVGDAVPEPLGPELRSVAALHRLGADPRRAWAGVPGELAALGRALVRAGESGAAAVPALHALATDSRAAARAGTEADVRRAGVWVLAPLGLCFLPAFVCLGVVPLVLGIAGDVLG